LMPMRCFGQLKLVHVTVPPGLWFDQYPGTGRPLSSGSGLLGVQGTCESITICTSSAADVSMTC
jgi:hypothetical protein